MASDAQLYQVSSIIGKKTVNGQTFFKVHWKGYSSDEDSWEPEANLSNCKTLIDLFLAKERRVTRSTSKASPETILSSDDDAPRTPRARRRRRSRSRDRGVPRRRVAEVTPTVPAPAVKPYTTPVQSPRVKTPRTKPLTTSDLSLSRYHLRFSTLKQRPPLHYTSPVTSHLSSDEEEQITPKKRLSRRDLHDDEKTPPAARSAPLSPRDPTPPAWMNLGVAEMILCLLVLVMVIASFWYLQYHLKTTSSP